MPMNAATAQAFSNIAFIKYGQQTSAFSVTLADAQFAKAIVKATA